MKLVYQFCKLIMNLYFQIRFQQLNECINNKRFPKISKCKGKSDLINFDDLSLHRIYTLKKYLLKKYIWVNRMCFSLRWSWGIIRSQSSWVKFYYTERVINHLLYAFYMYAFIFKIHQKYQIRFIQTWFCWMYKVNTDKIFLSNIKQNIMKLSSLTRPQK